jgi:acyl carrier protein
MTDYVLPAAIPSSFVLHNSFPRDASGEIDMDALRRAEPREPLDSVAENLTPTEEGIAAIWRELLHVDEVHRLDDFFQLGGHSLLATRVVGKVQASFGVRLPLRQIFRKPTVLEVARAIDELMSGASSSGHGLDL